MIKGQVISGKFGEVQIRQKSGSRIELGELLVADSEDSRIIMQAYDLIYGSQISQQNLELISGLSLEEDTELDFVDPKLRNYTLALLKNVITLEEGKARLCKKLPSVFSEVREITKEDLSFITKPDNPLYFGKLRSGSKVLDVDIFLNGRDVFPHHILIAATTGRGKSNLTSCMLWNSMGNDYAGVLVLDPHDEYYGRNHFGLKDHASRKIAYYTPKNVPAGCKTLKININDIRPSHFNGAVSWSDAQKEALGGYHKKYGREWIGAIVLEKAIDGFQEGTLGVVRRRVMSLLDLSASNGELVCSGVFDTQAGQSTISDIVAELESSKIVVVDTSGFSGQVEILIGSLIASEVFNKYKSYKMKGALDEKPVISVVLEEAPRVLGKEALERGQNIFSTIAREGRKFKIGLTAITQLPSLIPRDILANMNTKVILGIEMKPERQAIIESASQDLSSDDRSIASLDTGEAIITSNFSRFAIPVKIPLFRDIAKKSDKNERKDFSGVKMV